MTRMWKHPERGLIEVGDRDEAGAVCKTPMKGKTLAKYSREGAKIHPAPKPVTVNPVTRRDEWDLAEVRAWDGQRPGSGNHGGQGYHYRTAAAARRLGDTTIEQVVAAQESA